MKPHEEMWVVYRSGKANHGICRKNPRRTVATRIATYEEAMLIATAPEMARTLRIIASRRCETRAMLERPCAEEWTEPEDWCPVCTAQRVLDKAGIP